MEHKLPLKASVFLYFYLMQMNTKLFSYKVEGVKLEPQNDQLKISESFDRKAVLETLKALFGADKYKVDESSFSYKIIDDQLYIQGLAVEKEETNEVGFRFGNKS